MAMNSIVTNVGNSAAGGNAKSAMMLPGVGGVQAINAQSQANLGLGDASNRLRGGVFGSPFGVQNYGVIPKMGG